MSKDDYFVLVYKILSYLYKCLKSGKEPSGDYLKCKTKDFPIEESYWNYVLEQITRESYVEGTVIIRIDGCNPIVKITGNMRITPKGIEYLQENSMMKKVMALAKDISDIVP